MVDNKAIDIMKDKYTRGGMLAGFDSMREGQYREWTKAQTKVHCLLFLSGGVINLITRTEYIMSRSMSTTTTEQLSNN